MQRTTDGTLRLNLAGWAALLLMGLGSILIGLYVAARVLLSVEREQGVERFEAARRSFVSAGQDSHTASARALAARSGETLEPGAPVALDSRPDQTLWSDARVAAYADALDAELVPEGVLRIPAVGIAVPVYAGTAEPNLNRGAGRVEWTPALGSAGNVGVAAHRDGFFRPLKDIAAGDQILVELLDRTLRYEVTAIEIVDPEDVEVLAPTPNASLTLITCYPFYYVGSAPKRFIVQASLAGGVVARN